MLETRTDLVVRGALNGMAVRHRTVVDAIANVETPGFVPKTVAFEEQLRSLRDAMLADPLHTDVSTQSLPSPTLTEAESSAGRADGNGVSIDEQVVSLEINELSYQALTQAARMRNEILHSVLTETPR